MVAQLMVGTFRGYGLQQAQPSTDMPHLLCLKSFPGTEFRGYGERTLIRDCEVA